jgi:hypothetical protein
VPKPNLYPMRCYYCDAFTQAIEVARVIHRDPYKRTTLDIVNYEGKRLIYITILAKCKECRGAVILGRDNEEPNNSIYGIWPTEDLQTAGRRSPPAWVSLVEIVPSAILSEFKEATRCFSVEAFTASVVMVRRVLEGVCDDLGVASRTLADSLQNAQKKGLIDGRLGDWAQTLRIIGNDGAHFTGRAVDKHDAEESLALCEEVLRYMYATPARVSRLRARREQGAEVGERQEKPALEQ